MALSNGGIIGIENIPVNGDKITSFTSSGTFTAVEAGTANLLVIAGGAGGSGVVILRMATSDYTSTISGSPTVTTSGSDTILTFTQSGTYTS